MSVAQAGVVVGSQWAFRAGVNWVFWTTKKKARNFRGESQTQTWTELAPR